MQHVTHSAEVGTVITSDIDAIFDAIRELTPVETETVGGGWGNCGDNCRCNAYCS